MAWIYLLIGLIVGAIIGALVMRYGNRKLRQQQTLQSELEKSQRQLESYRRELVGHFAQSAELLNSMAQDYRKLYQHMAQSSNDLLPALPIHENPFHYRLGESEAESETPPSVERPRDYSEEASGLFSPSSRL